MPLHLLGKKSWNPYAPTAIAKVKADEAAAAAEEQALDEKRDEYDAQVRLAKLRGEVTPPIPDELAQPADSSRRGERRKHEAKGERGARGLDDRRKRRRIHGEDDTERDIRLAREDEESRNVGDDSVKAIRKRKHDDAPLTDRNGHIQLFAPENEGRARRVERNAEAEKERKERERELEDQYTMRFSNAAGFKQNPQNAPWYDRNTLQSRDADDLIKPQPGRNAFGKEDPRRHQRDAARMSSADPMAAMKLAQIKLKDVESQRNVSRREREQDLRELRAHHECSERRHKRHKHRDRKHRHHRFDQSDEIEALNLDGVDGTAVGRVKFRDRFLSSA